MSLPKYIVNIDELARALDGGVTLNATVSGAGVKELLEGYFDRVSAQLGIQAGGYTQRSTGLHRNIPALMLDFELKHVFDEDVYITGLTYSQTGWKSEDCWSLQIGDELLFDGLFTKELGEYKHFNTFYSVPAGVEVRIIHHNNSGNSKQVWFDIDYLIRS